MNEEGEAPRVYEIKLTKKYILVFDRQLSSDEFSRVSSRIHGWLHESSQPFLIIDKNVKLVCIDEAPA